jgi:hypothetical protein
MLSRVWNSIDSVLRFLVAIVAGLLPRYYWNDLELRLPMLRAAYASALVTFALAFIIGVPAFFEFAESQSRAAVRAMLEATGWRQPASGQAPDVGAAGAMWGASYLSVFAFVLLTPAGLISVYCFLTGFFRFFSAYYDDARGDPVLTAIDSWLRRGKTRRGAARAQADREGREGVEVRDRLVTGATAGIPDAEFVIVASRRKPGWTKGVFVITSDKWYRLGEPLDRETPNGLRTLYPINELRDQTVLRKGVEYELPPLSGRPAKSPDAPH